MLARWTQKLLHRLPSQCAVCHAWPAQPLCEGCVARFAQPRPRCPRCALALPSGIAACGHCISNPPALDACHAAVSYGYPWAGLIGQYKFNGHAGWARSFGLLLRSAAGVEPALDAADLVIPMPLSRQRLSERGFNQALLLARAVAQGKTRTGLLLRTRHTAPQTSLDRRMRLGNLRNAFAVEPLASGQVRGRQVVLIDDVMTSGASMAAAAAALRLAGAAGVTGIVLARTDEH